MPRRLDLGAHVQRAFAFSAALVAEYSVVLAAPQSKADPPSQQTLAVVVEVDIAVLPAAHGGELETAVTERVYESFGADCDRCAQLELELALRLTFLVHGRNNTTSLPKSCWNSSLFSATACRSRVS